PLGLIGETIWRVPSLAAPEATSVEDSVLRVEGPDQPSPPQHSTLTRFPAVQLFVERARAVEGSFQVTPQNAAAIARVCPRLDGIRVRTESAAVRVRGRRVPGIADRLRNGFVLKLGGSRALVPRHQTLAATFDWSWALLSGAEQALLRRLSVFVGVWTLDAA